MSRKRRYREDLTYAEWHRGGFPELYERIAHRFVMADRDWTEFCHYCSEPLAFVEEVRDCGQDLLDKATTVTRRVGELCRRPAFLLAWRVERPPDVQREIDTLGRRISELEARYPIVQFTVRPLAPASERRLVRLTPDEWWTWIALLHREHHSRCRSPRVREFPVGFGRLLGTLHEHPLHDGRLWGAAA